MNTTTEYHDGGIKLHSRLMILEYVWIAKQYDLSAERGLGSYHHNNVLLFKHSLLPQSDAMSPSCCGSFRKQQSPLTALAKQQTFEANHTDRVTRTTTIIDAHNGFSASKHHSNASDIFFFASIAHWRIVTVRLLPPLMSRENKSSLEPHFIYVMHLLLTNLLVYFILFLFDVIYGLFERCDSSGGDGGGDTGNGRRHTLLQAPHEQLIDSNSWLHLNGRAQQQMGKLVIGEPSDCAVAFCLRCGFMALQRWLKAERWT